MCGLVSLPTDPEALRPLVGVDVCLNLIPRWNVAPTQEGPVIRNGDPRSGEKPGRQIHVMRWGLVPSWAKDIGIGARLINARAETIDEKRSEERRVGKACVSTYR